MNDPVGNQIYTDIQLQKNRINKSQKYHIKQYHNAIYQGEIVNSLRNGKGIFYWHDGHLYIGCWVDDNIEGQGTLYFPYGGNFIGFFAKNKAHGAGVLILPSGNIYAGHWNSGKLVGRFSKFTKQENQWQLFQYKNGNLNRPKFNYGTKFQEAVDAEAFYIQLQQQLNTPYYESLIEDEYSGISAQNNNNNNGKNTTNANIYGNSHNNRELSPNFTQKSTTYDLSPGRANRFSFSKLNKQNLQYDESFKHGGIIGKSSNGRASQSYKIKLKLISPEERVFAQGVFDQNGDLEGIGIVFQEQGLFSMRGNFHQSTIHGIGRIEFESGDVFDGIFINGNFVSGVYYCSATDAFLYGDFDEDQKHLEKKGLGYPYQLILKKQKNFYGKQIIYQSTLSTELLFLPQPDNYEIQVFNRNKYLHNLARAPLLLDEYQINQQSSNIQDQGTHFYDPNNIKPITHSKTPQVYMTPIKKRQQPNANQQLNGSEDWSSKQKYVQSENESEIENNDVFDDRQYNLPIFKTNSKQQAVMIPKIPENSPNYLYDESLLNKFAYENQKIFHWKNQPPVNTSEANTIDPQTQKTIVASKKLENQSQSMNFNFRQQHKPSSSLTFNPHREFQVEVQEEQFEPQVYFSDSVADDYEFDEQKPKKGLDARFEENFEQYNSRISQNPSDEKDFQNWAQQSQEDDNYFSSQLNFDEQNMSQLVKTDSQFLEKQDLGMLRYFIDEKQTLLDDNSIQYVDRDGDMFLNQTDEESAIKKKKGNLKLNSSLDFNNDQKDQKSDGNVDNANSNNFLSNQNDQSDIYSSSKDNAILFDSYLDNFNE